MIQLPFTINKKILITIVILILAMAVSAVLVLSSSKTQPKGKLQQTPSPATTKETSVEKIPQTAFPAQLKSLIDASRSKPAGAKDSYYLLVNNEMVIAYNQPENTFIVTANGKSNEETAKAGYQAYLKGLGVDDLNKLNIIFRVRGQW